MTYGQALEQAKQNGHTPGLVFYPKFIFCQTCHATLIYEDFGYGKQIPGLHFSKCSKNE